MTRPNHPIMVNVVCTGRGTHKKTRIAWAMLYRGKLVWRQLAVDIFAGQVWPGEPTYAGGRWKFRPCPRCGLSDVTRREDTLAGQIEKLAAATHRTRSVDLDVSLLG